MCLSILLLITPLIFTHICQFLFLSPFSLYISISINIYLFIYPLLISLLISLYPKFIPDKYIFYFFVCFLLQQFMANKHNYQIHTCYTPVRYPHTPHSLFPLSTFSYFDISLLPYLILGGGKFILHCVQAVDDARNFVIRWRGQGLGVVKRERKGASIFEDITSLMNLDSIKLLGGSSKLFVIVVG